MSAQNSAPPSGSTPQNGPPRKVFRKKKNDNPLVQKKKRPVPSSQAATGQRSSGKPLPLDLHKARTPSPPARAIDNYRAIVLKEENTVNGFTDPSVTDGTYQDYPLFATKREIREGLRFHMAKFIAKRKVDPRQEKDFTRPVRLHRRDPNAKQLGKVEQNGIKPEVNGVGDKDKEIEAWKIEREREREANLAQIAPDVATGQKKKKIAQQKTAEVHGINQTDEQRLRAQIRYEEAIPWHLEDFDNKNTWAGAYEDALSGTNAILSFQDGRFTMAPVEKWYKFTRKDMFKTLSIEQAEESMKRRHKEPRWMMDFKKAEAEKNELAKMSRANKVFVGREAKDEKVGIGIKADDADEIDAEGADQFADDEEDNLFEMNEEEEKETKKRIERDQLKANIFNLKEEKEYDEEEREEQKEKVKEKVLSKGLRKALQKREKMFIYKSDSESDKNPFSDSSSTTDSEEERQREAQQKAEEEKKAKEKGSLKPGDATKPSSGASTKGTNTPSGRPKHTDPLRKDKSSKSLKRPGSPDLSELSGTDTSRKKPKKKHISSGVTGTSTPQPGSRPMSPAFSAATAPNATSSSQDRLEPSQRKSSILKLAVDPVKLANERKRQFGAGSGSDGEGTGTAGSGAEMSEGGTTIVKKKIKLNINATRSPNTGTPSGSRAGSPKPNPPSAASGANPPPSIPPLPFPTVEEIRAIIPPDGITTAAISHAFKARTGGRTKDFIGLVRQAGRYDTTKGKVMPLS